MFHGDFVVHKICFELLRSEPEACFFFFFLIFMARCRQQGRCFSTDVRQDGQIGNNERLCAIAADHTVRWWVEGCGGGRLC